MALQSYVEIQAFFQCPNINRYIITVYSMEIIIMYNKTYIIIDIIMHISIIITGIIPW